MQRDLDINATTTVTIFIVFIILLVLIYLLFWLPLANKINREVINYKKNNFSGEENNIATLHDPIKFNLKNQINQRLLK